MDTRHPRWWYHSNHAIYRWWNALPFQRSHGSQIFLTLIWKGCC
jgi:hypothetical protein